MNEFYSNKNINIMPCKANQQQPTHYKHQQEAFFSYVSSLDDQLNEWASNNDADDSVSKKWWW